MNDQQIAFARVLDLVDEAGCMPHVILAGSWAEFVYRESGLVREFCPNIKTMDVDFLIRNLRRPTPAVRLASLARERGFLVDADVLNGTTKLFDTSGLEVEFLIGKMGAGVETSLKTNIGVTAQTLRHTEILSNNTVEAQCLGHLVRVPSPEAYVVHKMVINSQRGSKTEKDARAVLGILPLLNKAKLAEILGQLTKKELARVKDFARTHKLDDYFANILDN